MSLNDTTGNLHCTHSHTVKLSAFASLDALMHELEKQLGTRIAATDAICIGAAGQYDGAELLHENAYPFSMPFAALASKASWPAYAVIHDYAPIVCATFTDYMIKPANLKRLNDCPINHDGRRVALGIGTGLGLKDGVLLPNGDFWLGKNEIGHIGIATPPHATQDELKRHQALIKHLQPRSLTFEHILSGAGTTRLYQFLYPDRAALKPEQIGEQMRANLLPELVAIFAWYLGLFVGTVQLIFMPEGGIWITGGVALSHLEAFEHPSFERGIHASPAYRALRDTYPLGILLNPEHALLGNAYYASKRLL
ncbi:MAG: hypothetical protein A3E85_00765 [Gammaproteobacteria bacterium RIFCSPHIGHO2_12_FULL_45_12]|nr:MAG: hypothetical protein A3E85_00765 [Gammaproteobacteria bacterium RIFCSPHIGHO2_12_FULL_45_12]